MEYSYPRMAWVGLDEKQKYNRKQPHDMSAETISLYIDLKSPYSYLAAHRALQLEADGKAHFDWNPYQIQIGAGPSGRSPEAFLRRARYVYRDVRRFATPLGLTVKGPTKIYDSTPALIGILFAKRTGVERRFIAEAYRLFFDRALDVGDPEAIASLLSDCGTNGAGFVEYAEGEGKEALTAICNDAEEKGVFAVPSFIRNDELYWGQDRMDIMLAAGSD